MDSHIGKTLTKDIEFFFKTENLMDEINDIFTNQIFTLKKVSEWTRRVRFNCKRSVPLECKNVKIVCELKRLSCYNKLQLIN